MIDNNLIFVREQIKEACKKAGRDESEVKLIAVSKTKPASDVARAYELGQRIFGENKVQELCDKSVSLPEDIQWHLIGHLQTNKIKYIIENTKMIHSVDSLKLAQAISKEAVKKNVNMPVLIEVNIGEEDSKFGISIDEIEDFIAEASTLEGITIKGLMTVAPFVEDPEDNRMLFRRLKEISVDITAKNLNNVKLDELSMGMTNDYLVAIEEGATFVRVGTAIFGERDYSKPEVK